MDVDPQRKRMCGCTHWKLIPRRRYFIWVCLILLFISLWWVITWMLLLHTTSYWLGFIRNRVDSSALLIRIQARKNLSVPGSIPAHLAFQKDVERVTSHVNISRVQDFVQRFTAYHTRYCRSETGRTSQLWLFSQVSSIIRNYTGVATVREVNHEYLQRSIIARLEGQDPMLKRELVILGAHLDSIHILWRKFGAPGADDNACGCSALLETLRAVVESSGVVNLKRTLEFHWYAGEEVGVVGSTAIAEDYKRRSLPVIGMLNLDMIGYHVEGNDDIGVILDYGDAQLSKFIHNLVKTYLTTFGSRDRVYWPSTSDHQSWAKAGFPAVMVGEVIDHPRLHSGEDTIEKISFTQVNQFIELAIAFSVELAEPMPKIFGRWGTAARHIT